MDPQSADQTNQVNQNPVQPEGVSAGLPQAAGSETSAPAQTVSPAPQPVSEANTSKQAPAPAKAGTFSFAKAEGDRKRKREIIRAEDRQVKLTSHLGDMIVPFVSMGVLLLLIIFVFIPFGTQIVETREGTKSLLKEIDRNENKIEKLSSIDLNLLEDRLKKITMVVRDEMDVAELAIEVEEMATGREVEPTSASVSNQEDVVSQGSKVESDWVPEFADTISGPFNYRGAFESITDFLLALRLESRTILSMGEINLSRLRENGVSTGDWIVSLSITGYTTEPETETSISAPVNTEVDQEMLDEILDRAEKYGQEDVPGDQTEEAAEPQ